MGTIGHLSVTLRLTGELDHTHSGAELFFRLVVPLELWVVLVLVEDAVVVAALEAAEEVEAVEEE